MDAIIFAGQNIGNLEVVELFNKIIKLQPSCSDLLKALELLIVASHAVWKRKI